MPVILIPLLMFAFALLSSFSTMHAGPFLDAPAVQEAHIGAPSVFYTRSGVVSIAPETGATRFTPYSRVPDMDRRRALRS